MAGDKKTVVKPFRMTEKEAEKLRLDAEQRGIKESEYIRLLLSQKPNDYPEIRIILRELINEVNAIGNNINQITRNHNSKLYREEDRELLSAVKCLFTKLNSDTVPKVERAACSIKSKKDKGRISANRKHLHRGGSLPFRLPCIWRELPVTGLVSDRCLQSSWQVKRTSHLKNTYGRKKKNKPS